MEKTMDTSFLDRAMKFAIDAHAGKERRGHGFPYVIHVMEAVEIAATVTSDQEILAAAVLHDIIEDTDYTFEDLKREFGERVAVMVLNESETPVEGKSEADSWHERKQAAMDHLASVDRDSQIVAIGDKLSNMRAIARDHKKDGNDFWKKFHESDPKEHAWRYRGLVEAFDKIRDTEPYREFAALVDEVFLDI